jgi:excinuclease UvrABC nuclease subunit
MRPSESPGDLGLYRVATDQLSELPARSGVFLVETDAEPYLNKSAELRRRVTRLLEPPAENTKRLSLHDTARAVWYHETGSAFESSLLLWRLHRHFFPDSYRRRLRLRPPMLVKLIWQNEYPRCYLTRRLAKGPSLYFGPFPSRATAQKFMQSFLDLFLIRRCVETIRPDPAHPGCIYGEMKMCLRPCQAATTVDAYRAETARVREFLETQGASLTRPLEQEREQAAANLEFERAAEIHKRLDKVKAALDFPELAAKGGLAGDVERLHGIVVQRSALAQNVELFPVYRGYLLPQITFSLALDAESGKPVSLDSRLREALAPLPSDPHGRRWEQLALLSRWFYRGTRSGEFVGFESYEKLPYRRIVNAIGRVVRGEVSAAESGKRES